MAEYIPDDEARDRRLAVIRARRGTPERLAHIEDIQAAKVRAKKRTPSASVGRKTPENSAEFFGHAWPFWFSMRDAGYEHITECARRRETTTHSDLWAAITARLGEDLGTRWRQIDHLLGYIAKVAFAKDGLVPTALVMYDGGDEINPGPGFFRLAASMGLLPDGDAPAPGEEWKQMTDAQRKFWEKQRDLVFDRFAV